MLVLATENVDCLLQVATAVIGPRIVQLALSLVPFVLLYVVPLAQLLDEAIDHTPSQHDSSVIDVGESASLMLL